MARKAKPRVQSEEEPLPVSPAKSLVDELDLLEMLLTRIGQAYISRLTSEVKIIRNKVYDMALQPEIPKAKLHDIREMLTLIRKLQTKPDKGRRKDIKKIDDLIGDLENFSDEWK